MSQMLERKTTLNKPVNILTSDILITDLVIQLGAPGEDPLYALMEKHGMEPGGKIKISKEVFDKDFASIHGRPVVAYPGGSSANTTWTMKKILGDRIDVNFLGVLGSGPNSQGIRNTMGDAGIRIIPESLPAKQDEHGHNIIPTSAVSYVFRLPGGERSIATYPGTAKQLLTPEVITEEMVAGTDRVFMQGSFWDKFQPEVADKILAVRQHQAEQGNYTELWLALPTTAYFDWQRSERFKFILPSAEVVLSNEEELAAIFNVSPEVAPKALQAFMRKEHPGAVIKNGHVAFVTKGAKGADVVTAESITHIDPVPLEKDEIRNTLGAGDTSFAGFLTGLILGYPPEECAKLGMALAAEKIKTSAGPRIEDPFTAFSRARPALSAQVRRESGQFSEQQSSSYLY